MPRVSVAMPLRRRSVRLAGQDYALHGFYFVTICTLDRGCHFGQIVEGCFVPSTLGGIVDEEWLRTPVLRPTVVLDDYVVMPNHFHGILQLLPGGQPLGKVIAQFKAAVTRRAQHRPVWQRSFWDRVIRDSEELEKARSYIRFNPMQWHIDKYNPRRGP